MARIKWDGKPFSAAPVKQLSNGDWLMRALEHGPRFTVGTMLQVKKLDIISLDDKDTPDPAARAAELEAAMAEERKTLPTVAELLANKDKADAVEG